MSDAQDQAVARVRELDARERELRAALEQTRAQLRAAVAAAVDEHGVALARLAREIDRQRPALYRWLDEARSRRP